MADFDFGGWLQPGMGTARNTTSVAERVLIPDEWRCTCSRTVGYEVDDSGVHSQLRPVVVRRPGTGCPVHGNT